MVERDPNQYKNLSDRRQLDAYGTPMPKSPMQFNFDDHMEK